jgi:hypothetical protein
MIVLIITKFILFACKKIIVRIIDYVFLATVKMPIIKKKAYKTEIIKKR